MNRNTHWNSCFENAENKNSTLGWQENNQNQTNKFIKQIPITQNTQVFIAGAGTSELVDELAERVGHLVLNDISDVALSSLTQRLNFINYQTFLHDLGTEFTLETPVDLWVDRAVLHFLLSEQEITQYFNNVRKNIVLDGYVLLAEFASGGATRCAGLNVHRYSIEELVERLGKDFALVSSEYFTFKNPFGDERPYVYTLFKRVSL